MQRVLFASPIVVASTHLTAYIPGYNPSYKEIFIFLMNTPQQHFSIADYLDVTEFILTEHNPDESEENSMPTIQIVVEVSYFLEGARRHVVSLVFFLLIS